MRLSARISSSTMRSPWSPVSANYGFGGTNAHAILRAPDAAEADPAEDKDAETARALVISAQSEAALRRACPRLRRDRLLRAVTRRLRACKCGVRPGGVCLPIGRSSPCGPARGSSRISRRSRQVSSPPELRCPLHPATTNGSLSFFPGNGCQWVGMGRSALLRSPDFAPRNGRDRRGHPRPRRLVGP